MVGVVLGVAEGDRHLQEAHHVLAVLDAVTAERQGGDIAAAELELGVVPREEGRGLAVGRLARQGGTGQQHQQEKRERDVPEIHGEPRRARVNAHSSSLWQLPYPGPASMRRQAEEGTQLLAQAVHVTAMALPQPAAITLRQPARLAVTFAQ